jgi:uncharacterized protein (TIGR03083 family)
VTDYPYGILPPDDYVAYMRQQAAGFASALRTGPLDVRVPSCPEWTVRELAAHLGGVHEWVCAIVTTGRQDRRHGPIEGEPAEWYERRAAQLLDALLDNGPDHECWTHQRDNRRTGYWFRRQAHEIAMHRADAALAISGSAAYPAELAADGIGEVLDIWMPRMAKYRGPQPLRAPVSLRATDTSHRWLLSPEPDAPPKAIGPHATGDSVAEVSGSAADLLFLLWKRPSTVDVIGDRACAEEFLGAALTS